MKSYISVFAIFCAMFVCSINLSADNSYRVRSGDLDRTTEGQVSMIQRLLGIKPTGYFGVKTKESVKSFQKKHNLRVTGIVDENTKNKLIDVDGAIKREDQAELTLSDKGEWEYGTIQTVSIPTEIRKQVGKTFSIRLISQNAFAHGDVYYIALDVPITNSIKTYEWIVGTTTAQSVSSGPTVVPSGLYELEICASLQCLQKRVNVHIHNIKAPQNKKAVMASLSTGGLYYNYIHKGTEIIDENGYTYPVKKVVTYPGKVQPIYFKTKEGLATSTLISLHGEGSRAGRTYVIATSSLKKYSFAWVVGQPETIDYGMYYVSVCIQSECNTAKEKVEIQKPVLKTVTIASSTYTYPTFMSLKKTVDPYTGLIRHVFVDGQNKVLLTIAETSGDIMTFPTRANPVTVSPYGYEIYGLLVERQEGTTTKLIRLGSSKYLVVEGNSVLVKYITDSVTR